MSNARSDRRKIDGLNILSDADDDQCPAARAGFPKRSSFNFELAEEVCLDVVREILAMYMSADANHWETAIDVVETHLGNQVSAQFVAHVTNVVRALRVERRCPFNFLTLGCKHITSDELAMMAALQAARGSRRFEGADTLQYLAQSDSHPRLQSAIMQLARLLAEQSAIKGRHGFMQSGAPADPHKLH